MSSIGEVIRGHEQRSLQAQCVLRLFILGLVCINEAELVPGGARWTASLVITCFYGTWLVLLVTRVAMHRRVPGQVPCIIVDTAALTSILVVTGGFQEFYAPSTGLDYLDYAYLLLPILTAFQIDPRTTLLVSIIETGAWLCGAGFTTINPDWTLIRHFALLSGVVGLACVFISAINKSRVLAIADLAETRAHLLDENIAIEERERLAMSEAIHDGPLQILLATRHDVLDIREQFASMPEGSSTVERVDRNVQMAVADLRTVIRGLHPTVAQEIGLVESIQNLANISAQRGGFNLEFCDELSSHDAQISDRIQKVATSAVREFLENAIKYSRARNLRVALRLSEKVLHLEVSDDGVGAPTAQLRSNLRQGHIGIASQRARVESVGGNISIHGSEGNGVTVMMSIPLE
ncbi:ATP-binding protein [Streptomyces sp. NPDC048309]|uniref:sensor histidine kinase n=1 Tax=Streptomyces sp. NPDC048309 TaxID=3154618 RepID=UPI0033F881E3